MNPIQVQKFLGGLDYPTDRNSIVERARQRGADTDVIQTLQSLPRDDFNSPNDVSEAIGQLNRGGPLAHAALPGGCLTAVDPVSVRRVRWPR
jgi:hypothetical protein